MTRRIEQSAASRPDFGRRSDAAEWLDGAMLDSTQLAVVLRDLAWFNTAMLGHYPILKWIARAARRLPERRTLRLIDAGCGHGDLLRAIRRWANRHNVPIALLGLDMNPETIRVARQATDVAAMIEFAVADVLHFEPAEPVDLIVNSLLAHHLGNVEIIGLLRWMDTNARRGWLVCDLQRHPVPYRVIGAAGRIFRLHPTVVHDGQVSVTRALTRQEWNDLVAAAGLPADDVTIGWFLFRWLIGRDR